MLVSAVRPRRLAAALVAALALAALVFPGSPAASQTSEPAYPSPEWFAREADNYAVNGQEPMRQMTDPAFILRWQEQSAANRDEYIQRRYLEGTWWWESSGNLCAQWAMQCTGDPYLYPGVDDFYETEGLVEDVVYFDSDGALLSGRVWVPRDSEPGDDLPGVVIETGSVQAPETLYWWFAQTLVRNGYAVMTYDVRGQGRSDNRAANGQPGSNFNSNVFATNLVDSIELFLSSPDAPYPHGFERAGVPLTEHNPFHDRIDPNRLGIVGHSLGATGVSVVQGITDWPGRLLDHNPVDVAVAWDNLSGSGSLAGHSVMPRVPTMGQAGDYFLVPTPYTSPPSPEGKSAGFNAWRAAGVPTYQVQVRGGAHYEWSYLPTFPSSSWDDWGNPMVEHYSLAWLDRWLKLPGEAGYDDADARLLSDEQFTDRMSFYFLSGRFFPTRAGVWHDCTDIKEGCDVPADPEEPRAAGMTLTAEGSGANRVLTATLTDAETGSGIAGKEIAFFADGEPIGTSITDAQGRATLRPPRPYFAGKRIYRAEFAGDEEYAPVAAEEDTGP